MRSGILVRAEGKGAETTLRYEIIIHEVGVKRQAANQARRKGAK